MSNYAINVSKFLMEEERRGATNGGEKTLASPFSRSVAIVALLRWTGRLGDEDYKAFLDGETLTVTITAKENSQVTGVIAIISHDGWSDSIPGHNLDEKTWSDPGMFLLVGKAESKARILRRGQPKLVVSNFMADRPDDWNDLDAAIEKVISDVYGVDFKSEDTLSALLALHAKTTGEESRTAKATPPATQQTSKQNGHQSSALETNADGSVKIGNSFQFNATGMYELISAHVRKQGSAEQLKDWQTAIMGVLRRVVGMVFRAKNNRDATSDEINTEILSLLGTTPQAVAAAPQATIPSTSTTVATSTTSSPKEEYEDLGEQPFEGDDGGIGDALDVDAGIPVSFDRVWMAVEICYGIIENPKTPIYKSNRFRNLSMALNRAVHAARVMGYDTVGMDYLHNVMARAQGYKIRYEDDPKRTKDTPRDVRLPGDKHLYFKAPKKDSNNP